MLPCPCCGCPWAGLTREGAQATLDVCLQDGDKDSDDTVPVSDLAQRKPIEKPFIVALPGAWDYVGQAGGGKRCAAETADGSEPAAVNRGQAQAGAPNLQAPATTCDQQSLT